MNVEIWVAVISGIASVVGVIIATVWGSKKNEKSVKEQTDLTIYRIDQLEKKVEKHNQVIERTFNLEKQVEVDEEKLDEMRRRVKDLEKYHE